MPSQWVRGSRVSPSCSAWLPRPAPSRPPERRPRPPGCPPRPRGRSMAPRFRPRHLRRSPRRSRLRPHRPRFPVARRYPCPRLSFPHRPLRLPSVQFPSLRSGSGRFLSSRSGPSRGLETHHPRLARAPSPPALVRPGPGLAPVGSGGARPPGAARRVLLPRSPPPEASGPGRCDAPASGAVAADFGSRFQRRVRRVLRACGLGSTRTWTPG